VFVANAIQSLPFHTLTSISTCNLQESILLFGILLTGPIFAYGKLPIPLYYGMIFRQLPDIDYSASAKIKTCCKTWSAKAEGLTQEEYL
jgi:hypothetical protein